MTGLRARLFAYLAVAAVAGAALTAVAGLLLARAREDARRETALTRQATTLAAGLAPSGATRVFALTARGVRRVAPRRAQVVLARLPEPPRGRGRVKAPHANRTLIWAGVPAGPGTAVLVRPAARLAGDPASVASSLLLAGAVGALVAAGLALLLARRLGRPLRELAGAAAAVGAGRQAEVPVRGDDELAGVARAFNAMSTDLAASRAAERGFLLSVSHELKTPLTAVRGYAEALADGAVAPEEAGRTIAAEGARLERLVGDLLDLGRLEAHAFTVAHEPVDLAAVARETVERFAPAAAAADVTLMAETKGPAPARGDHGRTLQVAGNLVENALRTAERVVVTARPGELSVSDDGPGLDAADRARAFERFALYERHRDARPVGTGLGLAIVQELARAMGGEATVESEPGAGATFRLRLPAD